MKIKVIDIGNSRGIRLSKTLLEKYQITDYMTIILEKDHIKLLPENQPRVGWDDAFSQMHAEKGDDLLIPDVFEDDDELEEYITI